MNHLKLPFLRRIVVFIFCDVLLVFKPVGYPYVSTVRHDQKTETPTRPPYVEILESEINASTCSPLRKCPDTETLIDTRMMCFLPPKPGYVYHCGIDPEEKRFVDFYYPRYKCLKGTFGAPNVDGEFVKLDCKDCPADRFNPHDRYSPASMDECRTHYHKPVSLEIHVVTFRPGNTTDPAVYYCDHKKAWVSENKTLFCRHSYQPCKCVYKGGTCQGGELLPDGRCVPTCAVERLPENNFDCIIHLKPRRLSVHGSIVSTTVLPSTLTERADNATLTQTQTTEGGESQGSATGATDYVAPIIIWCAIVIVVVVTFIVFRKPKCTCVKVYNHILNVGRDNYDVVAKKASINHISSAAVSPSSDDGRSDDVVNNPDTPEDEKDDANGQLLLKLKESQVEQDDDTGQTLLKLKEVQDGKTLLLMM